MGKWINSNNWNEVTDQTYAIEICQRCTFDRKKEIPYRHIYVHMARWLVLSGD